MTDLQEIITQFELHSVEGIRHYFLKGVNPNLEHEGKPLIYALINMYTRTPRFKDCIKTFVDHGLVFNNELLLSVLMNDAKTLKGLIVATPEMAAKKYNLDCTYTPMKDVSLLHICAEYNHVECARVLTKQGADVNEKAGVDEVGFGGQTPIFHTVNQNSNNSIDMLHHLLQLKADLSLTVQGLIWGKRLWVGNPGACG